MADAHYGYVGAGKGMVNLYKGQQMVRKNVDAAYAVEELIALIRENGDWTSQPGHNL
jgi:(E)-4-hydroxy-3-methylbut-2-enyl-diphosphate synthase